MILGSGRSGTSMVAGVLSSAGYYMGEDLYPGNESNPKGFFESPDINRINERLIGAVVKPRPRGWRSRFYRTRPVAGQRWLALVPIGTTFVVPEDIEDQIATLTSKQPYCFKDPRFCYTLPAWRPHVDDAVFVCIFREPTRTANSILHRAGRSPQLRSLHVTRAHALHVWTSMYEHVLETHSRSGEWLFVHYDQILSGESLPALEAALGVKLSDDFTDPELKRTADGGEADPSSDAVYRQLCERAGYSP